MSKRITSLYRLEGPALERKEARDRELEAIIKGEDQRSFLWSGLALLIMKKLWWTMPVVWQTCKSKKIRFSLWCGSIRLNPRTNGDGYKGLMHQPDTHAAPSFVDGLKAVRHLHCRDYRNWFDNCGWVALSSKSSLCWRFDFLSCHWSVRLKTRSTALYLVGFCPTGMKNPTSGNLSVMFNAIYAAQHPQNFVQCPSSGNIRKSFSPYDPREAWCKW